MQVISYKISPKNERVHEYALKFLLEYLCLVTPSFGQWLKSRPSIAQEFYNMLFNCFRSPIEKTKRTVAAVLKLRVFPLEQRINTLTTARLPSKSPDFEGGDWRDDLVTTALTKAGFSVNPDSKIARIEEGFDAPTVTECRDCYSTLEMIWLNGLEPDDA